jgi:hypothetical protein
MYARLQSRCSASADALTVAAFLDRAGDRFGDGRAINGDGLSHRVNSCCVAIGYSGWGVSVKAVPYAAQCCELTSGFGGIATAGRPTKFMLGRKSRL